MIGLLIGRVAHEEPTGALILDVHGVGYELLCPVATASRAKRDGDVITVHVHTNLRQDAIELFGFSSAEERSTFRLLVAVPNVGPRLALSVLNVLPTADLASAIESEDRVRLGKVPGVGKKTAERLVLELRGKLTLSRPGPGQTTAPPGGGEVKARLVSALTSLGYKAAEAERAAKALVTDPSNTDLSSLLRDALKFLAP